MFRNLDTFENAATLIVIGVLAASFYAVSVIA